MALRSQAGATLRMAYIPSMVWRLRFFFSMRVMVLNAGLSGHMPLEAISISKARHWLAVLGVRLSSNSAIIRIEISSTALPVKYFLKRLK